MKKLLTLCLSVLFSLSVFTNLSLAQDTSPKTTWDVLGIYEREGKQAFIYITEEQEFILRVDDEIFPLPENLTENGAIYIEQEESFLNLYFEFEDENVLFLLEEVSNYGGSAFSREFRKVSDFRQREPIEGPYKGFFCGGGEGDICIKDTPDSEDRWFVDFTEAWPANIEDGSPVAIKIQRETVLYPVTMEVYNNTLVVDIQLLQ